MLSRHSSHWNIHKRDESRQTLAVLSPKPRNGCSHFKRPSILLAQDCPVWGITGKKRVSTHRRGAGAKISFLNEYARDLVVCLIVPGCLSSSPNFDRSLRWFVVLLALLSQFLVARATKNCRYSCPVHRYWLKKHAHAAAAAAAHSARACMHAHNSSSIGRRPPFGSVNLDSCVEDGFFLFFGVWIRRIGAYFSPSPTRKPLCVLSHNSVQNTSRSGLWPSIFSRRSPETKSSPGTILFAQLRVTHFIPEDFKRK